MRSMMILLSNTMPYGRQQSLGCQWHNKRPLGGGMPCPCHVGFVHRTFSACLWCPEFPDHPTGEDTGFSQGTAAMCRSVLSHVRHPMQSHQGAPTMHGPIDDPQWGWCYGSLPVEAFWGGIRTFPHSRRGDTLLGEGDGLSGTPGPAPLQVKIPRFVEPAKKTTPLVTYTAPHCHTFLNRQKS